jgi:hypothetical protein
VNIYGTDQSEQPRPAGITGAGHPQDEAELNARIAEDQAGDIRHKGIDVPHKSSPFTTAQQQVFFEALNEVTQLNKVPNGYGVAEAEWSQDGYPTLESVRVRSGRKTIDVELPFDIWWPQAVRWVQGLDCMIRLMVELEQQR